MIYRTTEEQKQKRLQEFHEWFDEFASYMRLQRGIAVTFEERAAESVNANYWEFMDNNVRKYIKHRDNQDHSERVDRHKIASLMELIVAATLPIAHNDKEVRYHYNALLAFCCAMNVVKKWKSDGDEARNILRGDMDDAFVRAHINLLEYTAATSDIPVFSNAATWYLVEKLARINAEKV